MATIEAASASRTDVNNAITAAVTGDTVTVPAGSATWSSSISIPSTKSITVEGAGIGNTVIAGGGFTCGENDLGAVKRPNTIGGFTFNNGYILEYGSLGFRFHHMRFVTASFTEGVDIVGVTSPAVHPEGVVDHCEFINCRVLVRGTGALWNEGNMQHQLWHQDLSLGVADHTVVVEDCYFDASVFGNCVDSNYGGRYVFRHNIVEDLYLEVHSVQGNNRASRSWEIYDNEFRVVDKVSEGGIWAPMFIRGGTGVVYNNVLKNYNNGIALNNVRDTESTGCGLCDGNCAQGWDQNTAGQAGWACRDQIGRGRDTALWAPGQVNTQTSEPAYIWGNVDHDGQAVTPFVHNASSPNHIQVNRDYYLSAKPGYAALVYPHPLVSGVSPPPGPPPMRQGVRLSFG